MGVFLWARYPCRLPAAQREGTTSMVSNAFVMKTAQTKATEMVSKTYVLKTAQTKATSMALKTFVLETAQDKTRIWP